MAWLKALDLCQSLFLLRDAMHKRGLSRRAMSVRLSVRLSVTFVYSVETNKYTFSFFSESSFYGQHYDCT